MPRQQDPTVPFHPSEPSPGLVTVALCVTLILAAFTFLMRAA
ncbi:hypothetical protein [Methylobacterium nonmethylotrophicum]|nr:hypothetical protein [Methylobacterium nonmethylotrophicum]